MTTQKSQAPGTISEFWKPMVPTRGINDWESAIIVYLMEQPFRGCDEVRRQLESVRVTQMNAEDPSILVAVDHEPENRVSGHDSRLPLYWLFVQMYGYDGDGMVMWAMLLSSGGYLAKLDVRRADSSIFSSLPQPEAFAYSEEEFDRREKERRAK